MSALMVCATTLQYNNITINDHTSTTAVLYYDDITDPVGGFRHLNIKYIIII